jgi:signal peptidase I
VEQYGSTLPHLKQLEEELQRVKYRKRYRSTLRGNLFFLVVVAAAALLITNLWLPFFKISGSSMTPTLQAGDVLIAKRTSQPEAGDVVAFYYRSSTLVKRVIGCPGDVVDLDENGVVTVNGVELDEPYVSQLSLGDYCDLTFPYEVPEGQFFVLGDERVTSMDSRNGMIGCINKEEIIGTLFLRVWPLGRVGYVQ